MFNVPPLYNPNQTNIKSSKSPPIFNIGEVKITPNNKVKGIYNPFYTKKRNNDGDYVYEEYNCVILHKCIRRVIIIEEEQNKSKYFYFYLIKYEENNKLTEKEVSLEEIYFEDENLDFLYLKTVEYKPIIIHNKKMKLKKINKSISPNENMFQNLIKPGLTVDVNI